MKRISRTNVAARGGWRGTETQVKPQAANIMPPSQETMDFYDSAEAKDGTVMMQDSVQVGNGEQIKEKKVWRGPTDGKIHKRAKKTPGQKHLRLKKYVQPKNAVVCLNELRPGIVYTVEQTGAGCGAPTFVTVEVDGQKYRGFGSTKQLAKQAAAEAALISFVKPPAASTAVGGTSEEDTTPWGVLACFAMYKLFNEWREGRVGTMPSIMTSPGLMQDTSLTQTLQSLLSRQMQEVTPMEGIGTEANALTNPALAAYLGKAREETPTKKEELKVAKPAKQLPENAHLLHPVMLLHQMKPTLQFSHSTVLRDGKAVFSVCTTVDNKTFVGEGTNMKKAKFNLAAKANEELFNIVTSYVPPI